MEMGGEGTPQIGVLGLDEEDFGSLLPGPQTPKKEIPLETALSLSASPALGAVWSCFPPQEQLYF